MRISLLIGVLIILLSNNGLSQSKREIRKERRLERRTQTTKLRSPLVVYPVYWGIQDTRTSPGIYRVFGPGLSLKNRTERKELTILRDFQFNAGIGSPNFDNGALQYNFLLSYDINALRPVNDNISVGINAYIFNHNRLTPALSNSSYAMEVAAGLGPVASFQKSMTLLKKETNVRVLAALPVISHLVRIPEFGLSFNGPSDGFAPIGKFNKFTFEINAERAHRKSLENRIKYFYRWDFYGNNEFDKLHHLRSASHQIGFHLWIKKS